MSSGYQNEKFPRCTKYFDALLKCVEGELNLAYVEVKRADLESVKCFPDVQDLKPEQRLIVEHVVRKKDAFATLPTGFGKSLTFQILLSVFKVLLDLFCNMPAFSIVILVPL